MTVFEYLLAKYGRKTALSITKAEASVLGITYPLRHGWLKKHGSRQITEDQAARLETEMRIRAKLANSQHRASFAAHGVAAARSAAQSPQPPDLVDQAFAGDAVARLAAKTPVEICSCTTPPWERCPHSFPGWEPPSSPDIMSVWEEERDEYRHLT